MTSPISTSFSLIILLWFSSCTVASIDNSQQATVGDCNDVSKDQTCVLYCHHDSKHIRWRSRLGLDDPQYMPQDDKDNACLYGRDIDIYKERTVRYTVYAINATVCILKIFGPEPSIEYQCKDDESDKSGLIMKEIEYTATDSKAIDLQLLIMIVIILAIFLLLIIIIIIVVFCARVHSRRKLFRTVLNIETDTERVLLDKNGDNETARNSGNSKKTSIYSTGRSDDRGSISTLDAAIANGNSSYRNPNGNFSTDGNLYLRTDENTSSEILNTPSSFANDSLIESSASYAGNKAGSSKALNKMNEEINDQFLEEIFMVNVLNSLLVPELKKPLECLKDTILLIVKDGEICKGSNTSVKDVTHYFTKFSSSVKDFNADETISIVENRPKSLEELSNYWDSREEIITKKYCRKLESIASKSNYAIARRKLGENDKEIKQKYTKMGTICQDLENTEIAVLRIVEVLERKAFDYSMNELDEKLTMLEVRGKFEEVLEEQHSKWRDSSKTKRSDGLPESKKSFDFLPDKLKYASNVPDKFEDTVDSRYPKKHEGKSKGSKTGLGINDREDVSRLVPDSCPYRSAREVDDSSLQSGLSGGCNGDKNGDGFDNVDGLLCGIAPDKNHNNYSDNDHKYPSRGSVDSENDDLSSYGQNLNSVAGSKYNEQGEDDADFVDGLSDGRALDLSSRGSSRIGISEIQQPVDRMSSYGANDDDDRAEIDLRSSFDGL